MTRIVKSHVIAPFAAKKSATKPTTGVGAPLAIYVPSCDAYSDLWQPFFELFHRHWPDCPYRVYLGSNTLEFDDPHVTTLRSNKGLLWADRCLDHLAQIPEPDVLIWLEDFFLRRYVDTTAIASAYEEFRRLNAKTFRLVSRPGPESLLPGASYGRLEMGAAYRISTQAAFWKKDFLVGMILPGESIWEFEIKGSRRSDVHLDGFYGVKRDLLPYGHHVVERGKWFPWEAWYFGRKDIGCDFTRREIMPLGMAVKWTLRKTAGILGLGYMWKELRKLVWQKPI